MQDSCLQPSQCAYYVISCSSDENEPHVSEIALQASYRSGRLVHIDTTVAAGQCKSVSELHRGAERQDEGILSQQIYRR